MKVDPSKPPLLHQMALVDGVRLDVDARCLGPEHPAGCSGGRGWDLRLHDVDKLPVDRKELSPRAAPSQDEGLLADEDRGRDGGLTMDGPGG